jgi:hypothetical protein
VTIRKIYGSAPLNFFLLRRKRPKTSDIWSEFASTAKMPPPIVALHTQKVVNAFQRTNAE